jgi:hypothetical protein
MVWTGLTGILVDSAINLIIRHIPEPTIQERRDALARATKRALSEGVTAVVDFGRFFPGSPTSHVWEDFYGTDMKIVWSLTYYFIISDLLYEAQLMNAVAYCTYMLFFSALAELDIKWGLWSE